MYKKKDKSFPLAASIQNIKQYIGIDKSYRNT